MKALMTPARLLAWLPAAVLASCVVQSSKPPVQGGAGVDVSAKTGTVSLNTSEVPLLPTSCAPGQVVGRSDAGWDCVDLEYSQISGTPPVSWTNIEDSVTSSTAWPGTVPYTEVSGVPAVWPGTIPYSQITGAPADLATVQSNVTTLQSDMTTAQGDVTTLQGDVTTLQGDVTTAQGNVTTLQGDVATLQSNMTTAQSNITTLQGKATTAQSNIATLQGDMTTAQSNITTLQSDMTTAQSNITTLQSNVTTLQAEVAAVHQVVLSSGSAVAQAILVTGQLKDLAGNNVSSQVTLYVKTLALTAGQGAIAVETGTQLINTGAPAGQSSEAIITTTSAGKFQYSVTDTASGDSVWTEVILDSGVTAATLLSGY